MNFMFRELDHGIYSIRNGAGSLIPFLMTRTGSDNKLQRFVTEKYEDGPTTVESHLTTMAPKPNFAAQAFDGFATIEGTRSDAIFFAEVFDKSLDECFVFAQRYTPKTATVDFELIGNPALVGKERIFYWTFYQVIKN